MEKKIFENIYLDVNNSEEEFSIIVSKEDLYYNSDPKLDEFIFKVQNYYNKKEPLNQKRFLLSPCSLQEFYEIIGYFSGTEYHHRIRARYPEALRSYSFPDLKTVIWNLNTIEENLEQFKIYVSGKRPYSTCLGIEILVDFNKLDRFRELLKNIPGYKFMWLKKDNMPIERSEFLIK